MQINANSKRVILRLLILAIIVVVIRELYNVHDCISGGGVWNAQKKLCETILKKTPTPNPEIKK